MAALGGAVDLAQHAVPQLLRRRVNAGTVDEHDLAARLAQDALNCVAGSLCPATDDRDLAAHKGVEQCGLAYVRLA